MDKNKSGNFKIIQGKIAELPGETQKAVIWAIVNWELVERICKQSNMTNEEVEKLRSKGQAYLSV